MSEGGLMRSSALLACSKVALAHDSAAGVCLPGAPTCTVTGA